MGTDQNIIEKLELSYKKIMDKSSLSRYSCRIELGGFLQDEHRVKQGIKRSKDIFGTIFENNEIWVRLVLWNLQFSDTYNDLISCGFNFEKSDKVLEVTNPVGLDEDQKEDTKVCYLHYKTYEFEKIEPLLTAIFSYELALEPSANISAVFMDVNNSLTLINPYDDRGLDIITNDSLYFDMIRKKFDEWELK